MLSALEMMLPELPVMIPGGKLGLSNIVTMFTAEAFGLPSAMAVTFLKALFAGVTRGFSAFLMSFAGGVLSTLVMWLMLKTGDRLFGYIGIGMTGAIAHNAGQLAVAFALVGGAVASYIPFLMIMSIITGCVTGLTVGLVLPRVKKIKGLISV